MAAGLLNDLSLVHEAPGESPSLRESDRLRHRALLPLLMAISADRFRMLLDPDTRGQRAAVRQADQQRVQHRLVIDPAVQVVA